MNAARKEAQPLLEGAIPVRELADKTSAPIGTSEHPCPIINNRLAESPPPERGPGRPPKWRPEPGQVVALRGLIENNKPISKVRMSPRIGIVVRYVTARTMLVKLWMGSAPGMRRGRWCPRPRLVELANVARAASKREEVIGMVLDPLPAVAS